MPQQRTRAQLKYWREMRNRTPPGRLLLLQSVGMFQSGISLRIAKSPRAILIPPPIHCTSTAYDEECFSSVEYSDSIDDSSTVEAADKRDKG
jgi:hypothetical protein